ncbi:MAG: cation:proton antiporter [Candidatus Aegiribacteria sp.]|nr:cation:proton antiporter [Candidatus Aegiribacteria sp.]
MFSEITGYLLELREVFSHHVVFGVGILLMGSYFMGRFAEKVRLPAITGFILAGLLLGPSCIGLVHEDLDETLASITEIALALIALVIGSEFSLKKLRTIGKPVVIITLFQLCGTFILVTAGLVIAGMKFEYAAILGAIASATAPAATVAIIRELKARGPFVDHLYGVVALDDAGCVLLFAAVTAIAGNSLGSATGLVNSVFHAVIEIFSSIALGAFAGLVLHLLTRKRRRANEVLIVLLGVVLILSAISNCFHLSALLASMAAGTMMANLSRKTHRIINTLDSISPPLYAAFFAIAGAELNLAILTSPHILLMGGIFVLARAAGKILGVHFGASAANSDPLIKKYLGFGMLPQAGVAIGLVLFLDTMPYFAINRSITTTLINIVLFSVLVNELTGPPLSRYAVVHGAKLE